MNASSPGWQWRSQRGTSRSENRDACGVFQSQTYTFSIIVDASSKGKRGVSFNATWIGQLLTRLESGAPSMESIVSWMREAQQSLIHQGFLHEKACYAALLLPNGSTTAHILICGDCCVGYCPDGGQTEWLTTSHTLAKVCTELGIEGPAYRHQIVTRTLNVRRFDPPEVTTCDRAQRGTWLLATDGFRAGQSFPGSAPQDDCSCLRIGLGIEKRNESDSDNMLVRAIDHLRPDIIAKKLA
ncbi:hypothetical protein [Paraburkholderia terrae]|uniref:hypothetical protein n=1 Tax=Paraburkholderia terrae TaxID=311230 RepID=UPI001EE3894D|nr:hypothetical protein [Paraburkholderia terrae]GJH05949.1 hypothetical protein CBA19C8_35350 [Paraburkholderia terrae]